MKKLLIGVCCAIVFPSFSYGSNLVYFDYPSFNKYAPSAPYTRDEWAFNQYKREVEDYVEEAQRYVDYANDDKQTVIYEIQNKQRDAIRKANEAVEEFNRWANGGY